MPRKYEQRVRSDSTAATRRHILQATRSLVAGHGDLPVNEIARRARVSVQTVYTHFGSKSNLLMAVVDEVQREAGLYAGIADVWAARDGETALRRMIAATFRLWDRAWPFVEFSLRLRRTDRELGEQLARVDESRLTHLRVICRRLGDEDRLRADVTPDRGAELAFALTTPGVYEELAALRDWSLDEAAREVADGIVSALCATQQAAPAPGPIDWVAYGLEPPGTTFLEYHGAGTDAAPG